MERTQDEEIPKKSTVPTQPKLRPLSSSALSLLAWAASTIPSPYSLSQDGVPGMGTGWGRSHEGASPGKLATKSRFGLWSFPALITASPALLASPFSELRCLPPDGPSPAPGRALLSLGVAALGLPPCGWILQRAVATCHPSTSSSGAELRNLQLPLCLCSVSTEELSDIPSPTIFL